MKENEIKKSELCLRKLTSMNYFGTEIILFVQLLFKVRTKNIPPTGNQKKVSVFCLKTQTNLSVTIRITTGLLLLL